MMRAMIQRAPVRPLLLVGVAALGLALPTTAAFGQSHRPHRITYTATLQPTGGRVSCDPTMPARCVGTFENVITYSGDMAGTSFASGSAALAPDGLYHGTAIEQFSGSVAGCGDGTMVIEQSGTLDPATGTSTGSWRIVPGAGSGDLASATGGSRHGRVGAQEQHAVIRCG
jgi:hypothetical protein